MKNLIKIIFSIFLLSFASQNASAAVVKPFILLENVRDTLNLEDKTLTLKEKIETAQMLSKYSLVFVIVSIIAFIIMVNLPPINFMSNFIKWIPLITYATTGVTGSVFSHMLLKQNKKYKDKITQKFSLAAFILWVTFQTTVIIVGLLR